MVEDDLLDLIRRETERAVARQTVGVATVTQESPLRVKVDGNTEDESARALDSYSPSQGDRVIRLRVRGRWYVIGAV